MLYRNLCIGTDSIATTGAVTKIAQLEQIVLVEAFLFFWYFLIFLLTKLKGYNFFNQLTIKVCTYINKKENLENKIYIQEIDYILSNMFLVY